ncbi:uncharacterized protein [Miscanthus floridulus]|uniref:uncharacterized protein n=1 Tax=Miscanthus floridulus TaxID=154761 RepID=UPI003458BB80
MRHPPHLRLRPLRLLPSMRLQAPYQRSLSSSAAFSCASVPSLAEIEGKQIQYTMTAEDIRRGLKTPTEDIVVQRPVTNKSCPNCDHPEAEYYSLQMRSADEGETIFYTCKK